MNSTVISGNQYIADLECLYFLLKNEAISTKTAETVAVNLSIFYGQEIIFPWQ